MRIDVGAGFKPAPTPVRFFEPGLLSGHPFQNSMCPDAGTAPGWSLCGHEGYEYEVWLGAQIHSLNEKCLWPR
jgi:hypothetical protein